MRGRPKNPLNIDFPVNMKPMSQKKAGKIQFVWSNQRARNLYEMKAVRLGTNLVAAIDEANRLNTVLLNHDLKSNKSCCPFRKYSLGWLIYEIWGNGEDLTGWDEVPKKQKVEGIRNTLKRFGEVLPDAEELLNKKIDKLTKRQCDRIYNEVAAWKTKSTGHNCMKYIKLLLNHAVGERWIHVNFLEGVSYPANPPRHQFLRPEDIDKIEYHLLQDLNKPEAAFALRLAYETGQRLKDVVGFRLSDWDPNEQMFNFKQSKVRKRYEKSGRQPPECNVPIYFTPLVEELNRRLLEVDNILLHEETNFLRTEITGEPMTSSYASKQLNPAIQKIAGENYCALDLRRSCATRLADNGCESQEIIAITGHSEKSLSQMLAVYCPPSKERAKTAMKKVHDGNNYDKVDYSRKNQKDFDPIKLEKDVWSLPMSKLAAKYNLSDVGLKKRCKKLNIETPPLGFWTKVKNGTIPHPNGVKPDGF